MRFAFLLSSLFVVSNVMGQSLFNNAVKGGLTEEGLRTRPRPEGGYYSELYLGNAATAASFRRTTYWLADDFEVSAARWRVKKIVVWGYQNNLHYPSIDQGFVEVRRGSYTGPTVAVAHFSTGEMTDIYRIFTGRPNDMFQCQRLTFTLDALLPPGYYWIVFGALGVVNVDGPWSPFLTPTDSLTVPGANAWVRLTGTHISWTQIYDAGSFAPLDIPFWIDGDKLPLLAPRGEQIYPQPPIPDPLASLMRAAQVASDMAVNGRDLL